MMNSTAAFGSALANGLEALSVRDSFASEHAELDRAFEAFRESRRNDCAEAVERFHAFRRDLQRHVRCEEEVLFATIEPRLEGALPCCGSQEKSSNEIDERRAGVR